MGEIIHCINRDITTICFFIIKSEPMHNFILYLDHSGITNSIYWIIYALSLPILILVAIPIRNATIGNH